MEFVRVSKEFFIFVKSLTDRVGTSAFSNILLSSLSRREPVCSGGNTVVSDRLISGDRDRPSSILDDKGNAVLIKFCIPLCCLPSMEEYI